ncbi:MAG: hydrogenase nickel incorporation protein HypB [Chloroflexi bacterium]|nr:hydrogenase nickel incorporation protein HypB [Chloroflexota bacterium]MBU1750542.1 hydrogenase nickel incorporation protein HypB [Chloroflexota bacterium]MBU1878078.1 hydrogenase nickel incorporation protein HypB [Chloroflexota bacterium]
MPKIEVVERILSANDQLAAENRVRLDAAGVVAINIMASPGAGKTSLILQTIEALRGRLRVGVIEGDIASSVDADKVAQAGVPVVQINTGGQCHLDAPMVARGLDALPLADMDVVFVENVGNLVCPSGFQLGQRWDVVVNSVPEGDDKPLKYPGIFTEADVVLINKIDLQPYLDYDEAAFRQAVRALNADAPIFSMSCKTGTGLAEWTDWVVAVVEKGQDV